MKDSGLLDRMVKKVFRSVAPDRPIPFEIVRNAEKLFPNLYSQQVRLDSVSWKWGDLDREKGLLFLCSLAAAGHTPVVEFGTFRGRTTYNLALNCNDDIYTVDIGSPRTATGAAAATKPPVDTPAGGLQSRREVIAERLSGLLERIGVGEYVTGEVFKSAPEEVRARIHQRLGDSRSIDLSDLYGKAGLVIVDGGHTYEVCLSDSINAFKLIRPGGIIVWDDYNQYWPGVKAYCNDLSKERTLYFLPEEQFVVYIDTPPS